MPGYEIIDKKELLQVSEIFTKSKTLFRMGFEKQRRGIFKVKEFERDYIEFLNNKHRDTLDTLKAGKLTDEVIDTLTKVAKDLSAKFTA